jgi:hypothetical protein
LLGRPFVEQYLSDTQDPFTLIVLAIVSIAILGVVVYYSLKIDWGKLIGRWFPWALKDDEGDDKNQNVNKRKP